MLPIPDEIGVAPDTLHSSNATPQLSFVVGVVNAPGTTALQPAAFVLIVTLAGQVIVGACVSMTVTLKEHVVELLLWSTTLQVTVVVPALNTLPFRLEP